MFWNPPDQSTPVIDEQGSHVLSCVRMAQWRSWVFCASSTFTQMS